MRGGAGAGCAAHAPGSASGYVDFLPKRARRPGRLASTITSSDSAISTQASGAVSGWLQALITPWLNQPSDDEAHLARVLGRRVADIARRLAQ